MGCLCSSPYKLRTYGQLSGNETTNPNLRTFGTFRNNSVLIPDDIPGLPSTHIDSYLASDTNEILYKGEFDQGKAWRCLRPMWLLLLIFPPFWVWIVAYGLGAFCKKLTCDESCLHVRKEYGTRSFFRVYCNRIEINQPHVRFPWGYLGCGSWNADLISTHPFDRGAFGFRVVKSKTINFLCCLWPLYGGVVARQRCPCNGSLWPRMFTDCNGWWCDEWICDIMCCSYKYCGIFNPDEVAFACSIALQAYFEGRPLTKADTEKCLEYWRENISEEMAPVNRKRPVCCEPFCFPIFSCDYCYEKICHAERKVPYNVQTEELREAYKQYNDKRQINIKSYKNFSGPVRYSTLCRACGCRRIFGRKGFIFCTEGCDSNICKYSRSNPAPPFDHSDVDDENDASRVLHCVLGYPPDDVIISRLEKGSDGKSLIVSSREVNEVDGSMIHVNRGHSSSKPFHVASPHDCILTEDNNDFEKGA